MLRQLVVVWYYRQIDAQLELELDGYTHSQIVRQQERQIKKYSGREIQMNKQTDKKIDRKIDQKVDGNKDKQKARLRKIDRQKDKKLENRKIYIITRQIGSQIDISKLHLN